ncbi:MAG: hypothetical protein GXO59_05740 [Dictyoglomi bacterium]|nr:hypothetical protein [Dictyoglomota bacterium]
MKRGVYVMFLLVFVLLFVFVACGDGGAPKVGNNSSQSTGDTSTITVSGDVSNKNLIGKGLKGEGTATTVEALLRALPDGSPVKSLTVYGVENKYQYDIVLGKKGTLESAMGQIKSLLKKMHCSEDNMFISDDGKVVSCYADAILKIEDKGDDWHVFYLKRFSQPPTSFGIDLSYAMPTAWPFIRRTFQILDVPLFHAVHDRAPYRISLVIDKDSVVFKYQGDVGKDWDRSHIIALSEAYHIGGGCAGGACSAEGMVRGVKIHISTLKNTLFVNMTFAIK